jgi:sec-independent protein translocase protein TatA
MFDGAFSIWHLLIVAGIFVLLFGAKRLPDAARSLGKSARILKTELKDLHDDDKPSDDAVHQTAQITATPVAPAAPVAPPAPVTVPTHATSDAPAHPVTSGDQTPAS